MHEPSSGAPHRAIHLMFQAEETRGERTFTFFQNIVIFAADVEDAKARALALIARQGARVLGFEDEHTYESDPARVGYEKRIPEEGVVGISGRIYSVKSLDEVPRASLLTRLRAASAGLFGRTRR